MNTSLLRSIAIVLAVLAAAVLLAVVVGDALSDDEASPVITADECAPDPKGDTRADLDAVHGEGPEEPGGYVTRNGEHPTYQVAHADGAVIYYDETNDVAVGWEPGSLEVC